MAGICVTGYGLVSPLGQTLAAFDEALFTARSSVQPYLLELPGSASVSVAVARCAFDESSVRAPSKVPLDRGSAMALVAAEAAAAMAFPSAAGATTFDMTQVDPARLGIYWGSGMGGAATFDAICRTVYGEHKRIRPTALVTAMPNAPLAELALRFGAHGAAIGYDCACASAAVAIGEAMLAIRAGRIDIAIVGGSDALLSPGVVGAWQAMRVLASGVGSAEQVARACRPFSADRAGFALGEGAGALVIESNAHAQARGATWHTLLTGYASNCDGMHITQPDPSGQARAMQAALRDAGLVPADIGHVNAHGTATQAGDAAEAESLRRVFGGLSERKVPGPVPVVTATKAILGHLLGAGGAVELIATLRALERGLVPPTGHGRADMHARTTVDTSLLDSPLDTPLDSAFDIDLPRDGARAVPGLRHAISNSFAFGGTNAVLVASKA